MKLWDQGFVDAEVVGYICFSEEGLVEFHFGNANGFMGCRGLKNKVITLLNFHRKGMMRWIQLSFRCRLAKRSS